MFQILALLAANASPAQALATPQLQPMAFLAGHCWEGRFADGKVDTHCFESVYGGRFIRDRHEVKGGAAPYAGETLYGWNAQAGRVEYTYWNTSGGISRGGMVPRGQVLDFGDETYRGRDGREIRIATQWQRIGDNSYEARVTSAADPTGSRVVRYTRVDAAPVRIEETTDGSGARTLSHELVVPAAPADVYAAFASADGWRTWAVPNAWTDQADREVIETSYTPGAQPGQAGNIKQRFLLRLPGRLVAFRTIQTPPRFPHPAEFMQVTSLVELEPAGSGTRVRLSGIGYPPGAAGDTLLGFFREGNRTSLEQLRARFATGPIDWSARR
jgi:uncharacterized protein YndB with AHSA1/START domain